MAKFVKPEPSQAINLIYIRAAIESSTGIRLPLETVRALLVEEGLITSDQARKHAQIFRGYSEYFEFDDFSVEDVRPDSDETLL